MCESLAPTGVLKHVWAQDQALHGFASAKGDAGNAQTHLDPDQKSKIFKWHVFLYNSKVNISSNVLLSLSPPPSKGMLNCLFSVVRLFLQQEYN